MAHPNQLHVMLTDGQRDALRVRTAQTGASKAEIVRRAIDAYLDVDEAERPDVIQRSEPAGAFKVLNAPR